MSDIMQLLPAHLQGNRRLAAEESVRGMGVPPSPYISIKGNRFTLVDAAGQLFHVPSFGPIFQDHTGAAVPNSPVGPYLDAVLVDWNEHMSKAFYPYDYDPNQEVFTPPVCWSDNGVGPSTSAMHPQAGQCQLCPNNVWGSKTNNLGHPVKACDDMKKMAWYMPWLGLRTLFLVRLKGSSHRNWRTYVDKVTRQRVGDRTLDPTDLVTRLYFSQDQIGILDFTWVNFVDPETAAIQLEVWDTRASDRLVGRGDTPVRVALPPQTATDTTVPPQSGAAVAPQPTVPPTAPPPPPPPPPAQQPYPPPQATWSPPPGQGGPAQQMQQPGPQQPAQRRPRRAAGVAAAPPPPPAQQPHPPQAAQGGAAAPGNDPGEIPGFLRRPAPPPPQHQQPSAPPPSNPPNTATQFGQAHHVPQPNAEITAALHKAFELPTNP